MPERNDTDPRRSGKEYKTCSAVKRTPAQWCALTSVVVFLLTAAWVATQSVRQAVTARTAPPGKVWSSEHGHWHDAPGPPREAPPGKVWSEEHGHWHDAEGAPAP